MLYIALITVSVICCKTTTSESTRQERNFIAVDSIQSARLQELGAYLDSTDLSASVLTVDSLFALAHQLKYGSRPAHISYMALSETLDSSSLTKIVAAFLNPETQNYMQQFQSLEPTAQQYHSLKRHYQRLIREQKTDSLPGVRESLRAFRWMQRITDSTLVVINIPSAELFVNQKNGVEKLRMRVIVGSRSHQTPSFITFSDELVTYPYWNVPRSIALKEILPKVKRNIGYLSQNNMQIIDSQGNIQNPEALSWADFSVTNFPYRFRQSTGCDNALGLVKFNLKNPYSIYLHDTNARSLFSRSNRWLSHGCIRLQKPTELANFFLNDEVFDEKFMELCRLNAKPSTLKLPKPIPVCIVYLLTDVDTSGNLRWNSDVYGWYE